MATDFQLPVYIYVDSPNLWISAIGNDSRIRIEIGKLVEVVAAGRRFEGFWYRSNTPLPAAFENKVRNLGFDVREKRTVESTDRAGIITCNIYADITEMARDTPEEERSTFVIMTGDADVVPAIEEALEHEWKVEVVMWEHATSDEIKELDEAGKIELKYLHDNVTFTNRKFEPCDVTILNESAVVLKVDKNQFDQWHFPTWYPTDKWYKKVTAIAQRQFEYNWVDFKNNTREFGLVLYFNQDGKKVDLEEFVSELKKKFRELHIIDAQTYLSYTESMEGDYSFNNADDADEYNMSYGDEERISESQ